ncbi:MAG: Trk system potassium transporter TrkA [Ruminococcaceae bacterium]|nr:Trk system potassium transporter TrkA [Oscillospiraceae bacterium]
MNIIIVGCGKVGQKLTELLSREEEQNINITVVDTNYHVVQDLINQYDVMGVVGSAVDIDTLMEAGIEEADILIAVTGSDEINMLTCLMTKKYDRCRTIARVRKPEYVKTVNLIKDELSLAMVINPEYAAASAIARILRFPSAIQIDTFAKGRVEILKFRVEENSVLDNYRVQDIVAKLGCDVLVCGVERGTETYIPGGNFVIRSGDLVSVVAPINGETAFFKKIGIKTGRVKDAIIVGGGGIAYYLAQKLSATGIDVKIIEKNPEKCDTLCQLLPKATIINGDGTDNKLLLEEGLESAEAFVSLTNMDEENILLSLYAQTKTKGKVVTKINRISYGEVIDTLDLGTTIHPKNITAENIIKFVRAKNNSVGNNIETMHFILNEKAEALEFRIRENSPVSNIPLGKLNLKDNILIACINRGGRFIIPRGSDVMKTGDSVIVVTLRSGFEDITDILR